MISRGTTTSATLLSIWYSVSDRSTDPPGCFGGEGSILQIIFGFTPPIKFSWAFHPGSTVDTGTYTYTYRCILTYIYIYIYICVKGNVVKAYKQFMHGTPLWLKTPRVSKISVRRPPWLTGPGTTSETGTTWTITSGTRIHLFTGYQP